MPLLKDRKSMFGVQPGPLELANKMMTETMIQSEEIGDPKDVEDILKLISIFNTLSTKLKQIKK
jgi:hypothetical protein